MRRCTYASAKKADEVFLLTKYFSRAVTYPVALFFVKCGVGPSVVTLLGGVAWVFSIPSIVMAAVAFSECLHLRGWLLLGTTVFLWLAGYLLDVVDGSIARMTGASSKAGEYLDYVFHLLCNPLFICSIGVFLYLVFDRVAYLLLGLLSVPANWGPTVAAKEHVYFRDAITGTVRVSSCMSETESTFLDGHSVVSLGGDGRPGLLSTVIQLAGETIGFPGQFMLFSFLIGVDAVFWLNGRQSFPALRLGFAVVSLVMVASVPLRVRREFRAIRDFEASQAQGDELS